MSRSPISPCWEGKIGKREEFARIQVIVKLLIMLSLLPTNINVVPQYGVKGFFKVSCSDCRFEFEAFYCGMVFFGVVRH